MKRLRRKAMSDALTTAVSLLLLSIVFIFFFQTLIIGVKADVVTQTADTVANIVSVQGGIYNRAPVGYPGGDSNYISTSELDASLREVFSGGIDYQDDVMIEINNVVIKNRGEAGISRQTAEYDKGTLITVKTEIDYDWGGVSSSTTEDGSQSLEGKRTVRANRTTISEYKYRYSSWVGDR